MAQWLFQAFGFQRPKQNFSEQLWPYRCLSKKSLDFTKGVEKRIVAKGHIEHDLYEKPLTSAVFLGSSKNPKNFKSWSLRLLGDFCKHFASGGLTKIFRATMIMPFAFKTFFRLHKRCRKRIVAIAHIEMIYNNLLYNSSKSRNPLKFIFLYVKIFLPLFYILF